MHTGTDNRVFKRMEGEFAVRYSPSGSDREYCTTTKNISGGGIRISLLKRLKADTVLDLEIFKYNSPIRTRCRGKVVWIWNEPMDKKADQLFEAGVRFLDAEPLSIGRLISYLENPKSSTML